MTTITLPRSRSNALEAGFREAMANLCAPVSVITAMDGERPHGTTVSAVMSLSMDPLLLAVALAHTSECLSLINRSGRFGVNVLGASQHEVAMQLAAKGVNKFADVAWREQSGLPRLDGASIWVGCRVAEAVEAGDHMLLLGQVEEVETSSDQAPLTYHRRGFGTHHPHAA